jgi:hypothetical protein
MYAEMWQYNTVEEIIKARARGERPVRRVDAPDDMVTDVGLELMLRLAGNVSSPITVSICEVGSDDEAPITSDIAIHSSLFTKIFDLKYRTDVTAYFETLIATTEYNGTVWREAGMKTASNELFCRKTWATPIFKDDAQSVLIIFAVKMYGSDI